MSHENPEKKSVSLYEDSFSSFWKRSIRRLRKQPYLLLPGTMAYLRGLYYKFKFKVCLKHIKIGPHFRVYGKLVITGPGQVIMGKDCFILSQMTKTVCITTQRPQAKVVLGSHVGLNGTSIVCFDKIEIEEYSNIADAYITDSSAHPLSPDRRLFTAEDIDSERVHIGRNVWVSTHVVILKGVHIGENSVIAACSLVRESLPANILAAGMPSKVIKDISGSYSPKEK